MLVVGGGIIGLEMATVYDALGAKVTVLHEGTVLAEGSIDTVQADHRVIEVYLGR